MCIFNYSNSYGSSNNLPCYPSKKDHDPPKSILCPVKNKPPRGQS